MSRLMLLLSLLILQTQAASPLSGGFYLNTFCDRFEGKKNVSLSDGSHVDCATPSHVIEVTQAYDWAEAFGNTVYNSQISQKKGGIVLIMERPDRDVRFLNKLRKIAKPNRIYIWVIYSNGTIKGIH